MSTNGNSKSTITCPHCNQRFSVTMPQAVIFNDTRVSSALVPHEKPIRCICGKFSVPVMQSAQMAWAILPLTDEQAEALGESKIITPPLRNEWGKTWGPGF